MRSTTTFLAVLLAGAAGFATRAAEERTNPPPERPADVQPAPPVSPGGHRLSFAVVPGPVFNPSLGWGLMIVPLAMYNVDPDDEVSPGSTTAALGVATTNGSWGLGLGQKLYLARDRWRLTGGAGVASINQRFYGIGGNTGGGHVEMTMQMGVATLEGLRRVMPGGYAGVELTYRQTRYRRKDARADAILRMAGPSQEWAGNLLPGLPFDHDTRDPQTGPQRGFPRPADRQGGQREPGQLQHLRAGLRALQPVRGAGCTGSRRARPGAGGEVVPLGACIELPDGICPRAWRR
jgi:hypothetical protein